MNSTPDDVADRKTAFGTWLETLRWDHIVHLTTKEARREAWMANEFKGALALQAQRSVRWFYVIESTTPEHFHIHALLAGTHGLDVAAIEAAWRRGFARAVVFRPGEGGARYVTKELGFDSDS